MSQAKADDQPTVLGVTCLVGTRTERRSSSGIAAGHWKDTWEKGLGQRHRRMEAEGREWTVSADPTVRTTTRQGPGASRPRRVELGTEIHLAADRRCRLVTRVLSQGQHDDPPAVHPHCGASRHRPRQGTRGSGEARQWATRPISHAKRTVS
jgi:hypothetical protein